MLKQTLTYNDLNGNSRTEDFYFSLNKREAIKMKLINSGMDGLDDRFRRIVESRDPRILIDTFEDLITSAYGRRSEDGTSFEKDPSWTRHFIGTEAYSQLFERLVTDAPFAAQFVNGILPSGMELKLENIDLPASLKAEEATIKAALAAAPAAKTPDEMSREELVAALQRKNSANQ